mmetsp:Transcript_29052/g.67681  ORF Transcript_29052/g.67681 Transcript_29052/m.67681 type:complete len:749 (+) Transcript_29052:455-2701(+)
MKAMFSIFVLLVVVSLPKPAVGDDLGNVDDDEPKPPEFRPVGSDIAPPIGSPGPASFGASVLVKGDRLAVGNPTGKGAIQIYDFFNNTWNLVRTFHGEPGDTIGRNFDMSEDGSRIVIRKMFGTRSAVQLYNVDNGAPIGQFIHCGAVIGKQVSLSADGKVVAVSCEDFGKKRGLVKIFSLGANNAWFIKGKNLEGAYIDDQFGFSTSLSASGHRIAIGTPVFGVGYPERGFAAVYEYNQDLKVWETVWEPLLGAGVLHRFGKSVSLSGDGSGLVVTAAGVGIKNVGKSYIATYHDLAHLQKWSQVGQIFESENEVFDGPVVVNKRGSKFGVTSSVTTAGNLRRVRIFELNYGIWKQMLEPLDWDAGSNKNARLSVSLDDYDRFAFSSTDKDTNPVVKVMDIVMPPPPPPRPTPPPPTNDNSGGIIVGWSIDVINITSDFGAHNPSAEIKAIYEFDKHPFESAVFEYDCLTPVGEEYIQMTEEFGQRPNGRVRLGLNLDVNSETIANSPIYETINDETAMLTLCIQVDILERRSGEDLVKAVSERSRLSIEIDASKSFEIRDMEVQTGNAIDFDLRTSLDYDVQACQCDSSLQCLANPVLYDFVDARICIEAIDPSVEVGFVQELILTQDQGLSQYAVRDGEAVSPFAKMEHVGEKVVVRVRPLAAFFEGPNPSDVLAVGMCVLKFKSGPDRLLRGRISTSRRSEEDDSSMFDVHFQIDGRIDGHSSGLVTKYSVATLFTAALCFFFM